MLRSILSGFDFAALLYTVPAILMALSFHEWAHAYAAFRLGDPTAMSVGRMSLNPLKHIDPVGLIMLVLVRFGWAKPVPVNARNFERPRRDLLIVSLAGVVTNLILSFLSVGLLYLVIYVLRLESLYVYELLFAFASINLGLCIFNLFPIPPLDGFRVCESLLIRKIGPNVFMFLEKYGFIILVALLVTGVLTSILSAAVGGVMGWFMSFYNLLFGIA